MGSKIIPLADVGTHQRRTQATAAVACLQVDVQVSRVLDRLDLQQLAAQSRTYTHAQIDDGLAPDSIATSGKAPKDARQRFEGVEMTDTPTASVYLRVPC
jgi:hypothetical protein